MKGTELFKERFGPEQCNRTKYEYMVNTFGMVDDVTHRYTPHGSFMKNTGFEEFRELSTKWGSLNAGALFDHVRLYKRHSLEVFAISQPYLTVDLALKAFASNPIFVAHCMLHNYKITIFDDDCINWWNDGCIAIVFEHNFINHKPGYFSIHNPVLNIRVVNKDHSVTWYKLECCSRLSTAIAW